MLIICLSRTYREKLAILRNLGSFRQASRIGNRKYSMHYCFTLSVPRHPSFSWVLLPQKIPLQMRVDQGICFNTCSRVSMPTWRWHIMGHDDPVPTISSLDRWLKVHCWQQIRPKHVRNWLSYVCMYFNECEYVASNKLFACSMHMQSTLDWVS